MKMKFLVFWNVTPCSLVEMFHCRWSVLQ